MNDRGPRVFISYAHDSEQHKESVREFARFLRGEVGIDVRIDQWHDGVRRDWAAWATHQVSRADYILAIASPAYKERADDHAFPCDGRGSQFEAALLRDLLTSDRPTWLRKVLPVVLPGRRVDEIPAFLQPYCASHYKVGSFTIDGVDELYRVITGQPRHPLPDTGPLIFLDPFIEK